MATKQTASQILDYWFAIEFLAQDSYDVCTNESKLVRELKNFKKSDINTKRKRKQISIFDNIDDKKNIYSLIKEQAQACGMSTWGNLTFHIGKIRRQICIEKLAYNLGIKDFDQAEVSYDYIPMLSFQCDSQGIYIEHTLSLSTVVWALSQISEKKNVQISELLSYDAYSNSIKDLENVFFNLDELNDQDIVSTDTDNLNKFEAPVFKENSITVEKIKNIHTKLIKIYGKYIDKDAIEEKNSIKYQLFKDIMAKEKYDDDNYMGLSHDFFSNDLKMVKQAIEEGKIDFNSGMLSDLIKYICAPYDIFEERERHDFVNPNDKNVFLSELSEILNIGNSPLGKWPSRYRPALMQQVAINFAISNNSKGIFEKNGKIFSVNGPPGTGKTTMLKEIIASNIVEKAKILSQYDEPDDAFEGVKFVYGNINGAYSQYYPKWYKFKDDKISDYGVLVTSCNNNAVENITKELPLENDILKNLKINNKGKNKDSHKMQERLEEVRKLFSINDAEKITIYKKDKARQGVYPEIYFTGYAQKFLGNSEENADAWGLVAAPLGKKSNINSFYHDVLNPLWQDFLMSNKEIKERIPQYQKAKKEFCAQLEKVQRIQIKLKEYGDLTLKKHQTHLLFQKTKHKNEKSILNLQEQIKKLNEKIKVNQDLEGKEIVYFKELELECARFESIIEGYEKDIKEYSNQVMDYKKQALDAENSVSILTKLFRKSKYNAALDVAQGLNIKAQEYEDLVLKTKQTLNKEKEEHARQNNSKNAIHKKIEKYQDEFKKSKEQIDLINKKIEKLKLEIEDKKSKEKKVKTKCNKSLKVYKEACEMEKGKILDKNLVEEIFSENEDVSTNAQLSNPWTTEEYNKEREKLFYLALQMTKEFLLSSKSCRANLCILGQYWGLRTEAGIDKIKFHKNDSQAMIGSLFQTLFLLTPVVSSTFASVGYLLKDIKDPGVIGTLVVDEAGQAQPQMAVGALYRARRAIIVGDPKQVEPVVTDDLKLLKEAYSEDVYANYKNKSLSVQSCADIINHFGTFFDNGTNYPEWIGSPLLVHRRCISPMYDISNEISYNGIMKQQTRLPLKSDIETFILSKSQWINITGSEKGQGDHYVSKQGEKVCVLVEQAFKKAHCPNLYIITPFTSVVRGIRSALRTYANKNKNSALAKSKILDNWLYSNIGTVHKFQGKEANEVIFILGCDESQKYKYAVNDFVSSNIVNVAVTRAKYRLYIIGNLRVWRNNPYVKEAKSIIDTLPIKNIAEIERWEDSVDKQQALILQAMQIPGAASFISDVGENEKQETKYEIDSDEFVSSVSEIDLLNYNLSNEQYQEFGFNSKEEFDLLPMDIKRNLLMGIKLYYLLKPIYNLSDNLDASCCGILFCKGMELQLRNNFMQGLKTKFPQFIIKKGKKKEIQLQNAQNKDFMIGTIHHILKNNAKELGKDIGLKRESKYTIEWWNLFNKKLYSFVQKRNKCCHTEWFKWDDLLQMIDYEFKEGNVDVIHVPKIDGLFHESKVGKKLED